MTMIYSAARTLATLLAIIAAFVTIPNIDVAAALVILGLIAGLGYDAETTPRVLLAAIALPIVAAALVHVPTVGTYLGVIATNLGLATAGIAATVIAMRLFSRIMADWAPKSA